MKSLPLKYGAIMVRRGFVPVVAIIALAFIAVLSGTTLVSWKTSYLDYYLPQIVKDFFGKTETDTNGAPTNYDKEEPGEEDSEITAEDPTKDWKTYTNTELGFSFKYPTYLGKKQAEADIEVVLLESGDGKSYMNFYKDVAFGGESGLEKSDDGERKIYRTSDDFEVAVTIVDTGKEIIADGSFYLQIPGLTFTYSFDNTSKPDGLDTLSLILSTFKSL